MSRNQDSLKRDITYLLDKLEKGEKSLSRDWSYIFHIKRDTIQSGDIGLIKLLIEKGVIDLKRDFLMAVDTKNIKIIDLMLKEGADINGRYPDGLNTSTALVYATKEKNLEMVKFLLAKGVQVDGVDSYGYTALMRVVAATSKDDNLMDILNALLQEDADVNAVNKFGKTALLEANNKEIIETLVYYGANIDYQDNDGETALIKNIKNGNLAISEALIELGSDITIKDKKGSTALEYALRYQRKTLVCSLIEAGAKLDSFSPNLADTCYGELYDIIQENPIPYFIRCSYGEKFRFSTICNYYKVDCYNRSFLAILEEKDKMLRAKKLYNFAVNQYDEELKNQILGALEGVIGQNNLYLNYELNKLDENFKKLAARYVGIQDPMMAYIRSSSYSITTNFLQEFRKMPRMQRIRQFFANPAGIEMRLPSAQLEDREMVNTRKYLMAQKSSLSKLQQSR